MNEDGENRNRGDNNNNDSANQNAKNSDAINNNSTKKGCVFAQQFLGVINISQLTFTAGFLDPNVTTLQNMENLLKRRIGEVLGRVHNQAVAFF